MKLLVGTKHMKLFECLSSSTRIKILEILSEGPKNISELAKQLGISTAIITRHIATLEKAELIHTKNMPGKRGIQKLCYPVQKEITLQFFKEYNNNNYTSVSIPVGQYTTYDVRPSCGLASTKGLIGICDDPRYFSDPNRFSAAIIWFQSGWVEYRIPSYMFSQPNLRSIEISMEICSEFPIYKETWPSDIYFYLNGILLGIWTCPGDFGTKRGIYTPEWWNLGTQYGLLKSIKITEENTMLDGTFFSEINLSQIPIVQKEDLILRIASPDNAHNPGGINILGKGFGNYDQNIKVRIEYKKE